MNTDELWKNSLFVNENNIYMFNKVITEYDMKEAGFNLVKQYELLDQKTIDKLGKMKKDRREIEIGKIQRDDKEFSKALSECFVEARRLFFTTNELELNDILSIKKDAIFTCKSCKHQKFKDYINFRPKNTYTSYILLDKRTEIYYNPMQIEIKGINQENQELHEDYMIHFLSLYFKKMETDDAISVIDFTKRFIDKYKRRELEIGYYRDFDRKSLFHLNGSDDGYSYLEDEMISDVDIRFNYFNVLIKLIKIPL